MTGHWTDDKACAGVEIAVFFPEPRPGHHNIDGSRYNEARRICGACPVRRECLDHALAHSVTHGMFGGLTPNERARELPPERRQQLRSSHCQQCGIRFTHSNPIAMYCSTICVKRASRVRRRTA